MAIEFGSLNDDAEWDALDQLIEIKSGNEAILQICATFKTIGAKSFIVENDHLDRDFSAAFASFYASLFAPYQKFCRRLHFFASDISDALSGTAQAIAEGVEAASGDYLGFVVLRPLQHAPVGMSVVSARHFAASATSEISIRAEYKVHLLGAELTVTGVPVTQQDTRVGACAQAAIWSVGRHFHSRHRGAWYSLPDISELALRPTDAIISQSLPAGSAFLTLDNMVRAIRAMERHPVVYIRPATGQWVTPPHAVVYRYLDSGIPVILGLRRPGGSDWSCGCGGRSRNQSRHSDQSSSKSDPGGGSNSFLRGG